MKVSEVTDADAMALANCLNSIKRLCAAPNTPLTDMFPMVDGCRWLQSLAVDMARSRAAKANEPPAEGFTVKEYKPGDLSGN